MAPSSSTRAKQKIEIVVRKANPLHDPIVVSFPGGIPESVSAASTSSNLNDEREEQEQQSKVEFTWRRCKNNNNRTPFSSRKENNDKDNNDDKIVIGMDESCQYTGMIEKQQQGQQGAHTKALVGVLDRSKGRLTLVPISHETIVCLGQSVRNYSETTTNNNNNNKLSSYADRRRALITEFGSVKRQRLLRSVEANRVNLVGGEQDGNLSLMVQNQQGMSLSNRMAIQQEQRGNKNDAVAEAYMKSRQDFLPPFNASATQPHLVYNIQSMIGQVAWEKLSIVARACLKKTDLVAAVTSRKDVEWHNSTISTLQQIDKTKNEDNATMIVTICLYLNSLVTFYNQMNQTRFRQSGFHGSAGRIGHMLGISRQVCEQCLSLFTKTTTTTTASSPMSSPSSKMRQIHSFTQQDCNKCLVHILILYVRARGGLSMKISTLESSLIQDLNVECDQVAKLLREAGFSMTHRSGATEVTNLKLKVPLTFPSAPGSGRRKQGQR